MTKKIDHKMRLRSLVESIDAVCDATDIMNETIQQQAAAIALFYLEDLSLAEVSIALDIPIGTVKSRLSLARKTLKATLEGDSHV